MKRIEEINKAEDEKEAYISRTSDYISDIIAINYKFVNNNHKITFDMFFMQGMGEIRLSKEELQELYDLIERRLQEKYELIRINSGYNRPLVLKDLREEE